MSLTEVRTLAPESVATEPEAPAQRPRRSLGQIVQSIKSHRDMLLDPNFDPSVDIGSLIDGNTEELMAKVDNTVAFNTALRDFAANARARAEKELAAAKAAEARAEGNEQYVLMQLAAANTEEFQGHSYRYRKVRNSNPSVETTREPTVADFVQFGSDFVVQIPPVEESYRWDKKALCAELKKPVAADAEKKPIAELASLNYGSQLKFESVDKPIEKKKRGKKA